MLLRAVVCCMGWLTHSGRRRVSRYASVVCRPRSRTRVSRFPSSANNR